MAWSESTRTAALVIAGIWSAVVAIFGTAWAFSELLSNYHDVRVDVVRRTMEHERAVDARIDPLQTWACEMARAWNSDFYHQAGDRKVPEPCANHDSVTDSDTE